MHNYETAFNVTYMIINKISSNNKETSCLPIIPLPPVTKTFLLSNITLYYFPFIIDFTLLTIASGVGGKLSTSG